MWYAILWILVLATSVLLLAIVSSLAARSQNKFIRRFLPKLFFVLVVLVFLAATVFTGLAYFGVKIKPFWPFFVSLAWTLAFFASGRLVLRRGFPKSQAEPNAASWPRTTLVGLLVIALGAGVATYNQLLKTLDAELTEIQNDAVNKIRQIWPDPLPPESNAIGYYNRALLALTGRCISYNSELFCGPEDIPKTRKDQPEWFDRDNLFRPPDIDPPLDQVEKFLVDNQQAIRLIDQGVSCPGLHHELKMRRFYTIGIPQFENLRPLSWVKKLQAISEAQNGNIHGALDDLARIERMADQLLHFPSKYSVVEAGIISRYGYEGLEYILAHYGDNVTGALPLYTTGLTPAKPCLSRAWEFEKAAYITYALSFGQPDDMFKDPGLGFWEGPLKILVVPGSIESVQWLFEMQQKVATQPYPEAIKTHEQIKRELKTKPQGLLLRIFKFHVSSRNESVEELETRRRLAALAIAAFNYKQENGSYPASLGDLVPKYIDAIPIDPFDLKPLKMKALDDGLDLYSTGTNPESKVSVDPKGPIHFYLGANAYQEYRVKPLKEEQAKK